MISFSMYALSIEIGNPGKRYSVSEQAGNCHQEMTTSMRVLVTGLGRTTENKDGARQKYINVLVLGRERRKRQPITKSRNHAVL